MLQKSSKLSRILILISGLLLLLTYLFPLWRISLWAPQYPEGLTLNIWANKFTGDVQTVNVLNHYVGMHPIQEDSFPELKYFPIVFGILIVLALLFSLIGRKIFNYLWAFILVCFSVWAFHDFYNWEYKFGHDLNPDAPIKMDDMVYQPPLVGEKQFLNITAASWPEMGGNAMILSTLLTLCAVVITLRQINGVKS